MHPCQYLEDTPADRVVRFERLEPFFHDDDTMIWVRKAHWERRGGGFPAFLWLTDHRGDTELIDPLAALPDWLAATAPLWVEEVPAHRKAVG